MYEVYAKLTFNEPCLGNVRLPDPEPNKLARGDNGVVVFQPHWWSTAMSRAAGVCRVSKELANRVAFHPEIDGKPGMYKRFYKVRAEGGASCRFKMHEAFNRGDTIGVKAAVPDELSVEEFRTLLSTVGAYFGMSPFGWRRGFGRFSVKEVGSVYGSNREHHAAREPDVDYSGNSANQKDRDADGVGGEASQDG